MPICKGGPLDGATVTWNDPKVCAITPATEDTGVYARYDMQSDGNYLYICSMNGRDLRKVEDD